MNRNLIRALLFAWQYPEFRAGLQRAVDLDEVSALLAALSTETGDHEQERRAVDLVRSALDSAEVREALLLLVESDRIRREIVAAVAEELADRPALVITIAAALDDPVVRADLRATLETPRLRGLLLRVAEDGVRRRRLALLAEVIVLLARHRTARRLVRRLHQHGVLRALREQPGPSATAGGTAPAASRPPDTAPEQPS
ncbi:hypothetical protein CS0771_43490 [Catellatospora sp. IY07-71]|uniref:hypothetical protein n=1 Tax=Catellatospora sp. IY07-71 TaxID=2728827 RepID=UPI001BB44348|nr:hypothetical protein [Catellatospora sp. IY07-71]BCJ74805.1 hypothetical protein CS0771_43490 [Catellatospora sp. IY07-71]